MATGTRSQRKKAGCTQGDDLGRKDASLTQHVSSVYPADLFNEFRSTLMDLKVQIEKLNGQISLLRNDKITHEASTQTECPQDAEIVPASKSKSYAEVVKEGARQNGRESATTKQNQDKIKNKRKKKKVYNTRQDDEKGGPFQGETTPHVILLHDSTGSRLHAGRLSRAVGGRVKKMKSPTIKDIPSPQELAKEKPEVIVIQTGINDIRSQDPHTVQKNIGKQIEGIHTVLPDSYVVISKLALTKNRDINIKVDLYNALLASKFSGHPKVSLVNHNRLTYGMLRDEVHTNQIGTSLIARALSRHVEDLLWERPKRVVRPHHVDQGFWDWRGVYHYW